MNDSSSIIELKASNTEPARYEQRTKPNLVSEGPLINCGPPVFALVFVLVFLAFLSSACFFGAVSVGAVNLRSLLLAAMGAVPAFFIGLTIYISWVEIKADRAKRAQKKTWLKNAVAVQAVIVDRKEEHNSYAESIEETWVCHLALRLPPSSFPNVEPPVVWAGVSTAIYDKYKQSDTVNIYYAPTNPYLFLIEGE